MRTPERLRRAAVTALALLALAAAALAGEIDPLVRGLDSADAEARAKAENDLVHHVERDRIVIETLRADDFPAGLGNGALHLLVVLTERHELRMGHKGLRRLIRDAGVDVGVRTAAANALGANGGVSDVAALGDAVQAVPEAACGALANIGGRAALAALRRGAGDQPPPEALAAMVLLGDDSGLPALVEQLQSAGREHATRIGQLLTWATGKELPADHAKWSVYLRRRDIAKRLGDVDNDAATAEVEKLVAALRAAPSTELTGDLRAILRDDQAHVFARDKAALVLGLAGVKEAKDDLLFVMASGQPGSVRLYSSEALARVGDLSCVMPLVDLLVHDEDLDRIKSRRGASGEYFPVDPGMVRALYRFGIKGGAGQIITVLDGNYRTRMHRDCMRALREVTGGEDFDFRADSARADRERAIVRMRAWWRANREGLAIAPKADDPGWPAFRAAVAAKIELLGTFKFLHQLRAKMALVVVADAVLPELEAALARDDLHVRMGASEVLRDAGLRAAAPALAARLPKEENPAALTKLLAGVRECGRPDPHGTRAWDAATHETIRTQVRPMLAHRSLEVRIAAAHALGVVGDASDAKRLAALRTAEGNSARTLRVATAGAMLRLGDPSALGDVVPDLRSEDVALRAEALALVAAAGCTESGFDPDASEEDRETAIRRIAEHFGVALDSDGSVSPGERR